MQPIVSLRYLSSRIGKSPARLREIAADIRSHYRTFPLISKKNPNKVRQITAPDKELKEIQTRIYRLLKHIALSKTVHGGVRGKSPRSNAEQHLGQPYVVNVDVREFFPNIRHTVVYRMFRHELGWGRDVARLVTRLTTLDGAVPQGAPTSTAIANLVLAKPVDDPLATHAKHFHASNTRFVDDITFSGANPAPLIEVVGKMLSTRGLRIYRKKAKFHSNPKLKITPRSQRQEVTGLVVNSKAGPSISKTYRDNVRGAIFALRKITDKHVLEKTVASIKGKIAHIGRFNPGSADRYLDPQLCAKRATFGPSDDVCPSENTV